MVIRLELDQQREDGSKKVSRRKSCINREHKSAPAADLVNFEEHVEPNRCSSSKYQWDEVRKSRSSHTMKHRFSYNLVAMIYGHDFFTYRTPRDVTDARDTAMWPKTHKGQEKLGGARWRVTAQLIAKLTSSDALDVVATMTRDYPFSHVLL